MRGASGVGIDAGCGEDRSRAGSDERRPTTAEQGSRSAGEFVGGGQSGEEEGKGSEKRTLGIIRERADYSDALRVTLMGYGHSFCFPSFLCPFSWRLPRVIPVVALDSGASSSCEMRPFPRLLYAPNEPV